jgi:hypothetical protein
MLRPAIPANWTVLVLADPGLYAHWLFRHMGCLGWHPFCASISGQRSAQRGRRAGTG